MRVNLLRRWPQYWEQQQVHAARRHWTTRRSMHAQYAMRLVELQWYDAGERVCKGRVSESVSLTTECIGFARTRLELFACVTGRSKFFVTIHSVSPCSAFVTGER